MTALRRQAPRLALIALSSLALGATWPTLSEPARRVGGGQRDAAVVVGIERYALVPPISGAKRNATAWYDYLVRTRGVPPPRVRLLLDRDATVEDLREAVGDAARQAGPDGTLWFIFIGHGAPMRGGGDGLLVGFDAQQKAKSILARSLPQSELLAGLEASAAAQILVLLDACFSGRTPSGERLVPDLQDLEVVVERATSDPRTVLLTAARNDQYAGPLPGAGRPAFSYLALGALRGWADADADARVSAGELHGYVSGALETLIHDREQTPTLVGQDGAELALSAGEAGPDLAQLALSLATRPRPVTFRVSAPPRLPAPDVPRFFDSRPTGLDFRDLDVEALTAYDAAVKFDRSEAAPEAKTRRWRALAGAAPQFSEIANTRAEEWEAFTRQQRAADEARRQREQARAADWATLSRLLRLEVVSEEDKRAWASAFVEAYGSTTAENPHVERLAHLLPEAAIPESVRRIRELGIEWVRIPAGSFRRGAGTGRVDQRPARTIELAALEIMKTEVTVKMYRSCAQAGECSAEGAGEAFWDGTPRPDYFPYCNWGYSGRGDHPHNCVDWEQTRRFCAWVGADLPTEAQWEYAAGGRHGHTFPWGTATATCARAVMRNDSAGCGNNSTWGVCSKPLGNTPEGLCDMAGNVFEWTRDWYASSYYSWAPSRDPGGPPNGSRRVVRGGGWVANTGALTVAHRGSLEPSSRYDGLGFRCARSAP